MNANVQGAAKHVLLLGISVHAGMYHNLTLWYY